MGTRGLLGLIIAAQRHGTYNHFDSYPDGLGKNIMKFVLSLKPEEWDKMALLIKDIEWVAEESSHPSSELQEKYIALGYSNTMVGTGNANDWYCLLRNVQGAAALPEILNGNLKHMLQAVDFLEDGSCEWAYFVDFEKRTFETWAAGKFLEEISIEGLSEGDADAYFDKVQRKANARSGDGLSDSDDEEDEPERAGGPEDEEENEDKQDENESAPSDGHEAADEVE